MGGQPESVPPLEVGSPACTAGRRRSGSPPAGGETAGDPGQVSQPGNESTGNSLLTASLGRLLDDFVTIAYHGPALTQPGVPYDITRHIPT